MPRYTFHTKDQALEITENLVKKFHQNIGMYKDPTRYNEEQICREFIDKLFYALNWDVYTDRFTGSDREVLAQETFRGREAIRKPDYTFYIDRKPVFFLEAKHPRYDLNIKSDYINQAVRYAYSTQSGTRNRVDFAILTDFEELRFFDGTIRPNPKKPDIGAIFDLSYKEYIDKFDLLWETFERNNVAAGSLNKCYIKGKKIEKERIPVDETILDDLSVWREKLARNIALRNKGLSLEALNTAVQKLLDKLIFMRACIDREIEKDDILSDILRRWNEEGKTRSLIDYLQEELQRFNAIYNGGLFKRDICDEIKVDDNTLRPIMYQLADKTPYVFNVVGVEILGSIYERFLGKTIRLTPAHRAKVEDKPEVRKAGGIYYTPQYIVDYIVENTVGKVIEGKTPEEIRDIKILDPACGSGSFLISAYQKLLDHHIKYYEEHQDKIEERNLFNHNTLYRDRDSNIRLQVEYKAQILLDNIYGTDIDPQAVEVTQMSLYLKMLEGVDFKSSMRDILPRLEGNIKCGNSLIGSDILEDNRELFGMPEELRRINPFDWEREFKEIMDRGGFDVVIGNPPYLNIDQVWGKKSIEGLFIKKSFPVIWMDKTDILFYFIARGLELSRNKLSFIISRAFLESAKAKKLRSFILNNSRISEIIDFRGVIIFKGVGISTAIISLVKEIDPNRRENNMIGVIKALDDNIEGSLIIDNMEEKLENKSEIVEVFYYPQNKLSEDAWNFVDEQIQKIFEKIDRQSNQLEEIAIIGKGMETGRNEIFGRKYEQDVNNLKLEREYLKPRAVNSSIDRYSITPSREYMIYIEDLNDFKGCPSNIANYLLRNRDELRNRAAYKRGDCEWYKYTFPLHKDMYHMPKIMSPIIADKNKFALDEKAEYIGSTDTYAIFEKRDKQINIKYVLGLLNSKLLTFRFIKGIGKLKSKGMYSYAKNEIARIPIRTIDFSNPIEKKMHDALVSLVDQMLDLNKRLQQAQTGHEKDLLRRLIKTTDDKIDQLVYKLYNLTDEEIRLIEESLQNK